MSEPPPQPPRTHPRSKAERDARVEHGRRLVRTLASPAVDAALTPIIRGVQCHTKAARILERIDRSHRHTWQFGTKRST